MPSKDTAHQKSEEEIAAAKEDYFRSIKRNPLVDYALQTKSRNLKIQKTIGETSLAGNVRAEFFGVKDDDHIYID